MKRVVAGGRERGEVLYASDRIGGEEDKREKEAVGWGLHALGRRRERGGEREKRGLGLDWDSDGFYVMRLSATRTKGVEMRRRSNCRKLRMAKCRRGVSEWLQFSQVAPIPFY